MNRKEFKKVLKPLIKECIKEVIFEEGALSGIVSEVVRGMSVAPLVEQVAAPAVVTNKPVERTKEKREIKQKLTETRRKMLDVIGKDAFNGVDLFENTTPTPGAGPRPGQAAGPNGPLAGIDPADSGVDISGILNISSGKWKELV